MSLLIGGRASAQTGGGGVASAVVSAMQFGDPSVSIAAAVGYRFNPQVALGVEMTYAPSLTPKTPGNSIVVPAFDAVTAIYPSPIVDVESEGGHATIFTANFRLTVPTRSRRFSPYVVGGAGIAAVTDTVAYTITLPPLIFSPPGGLLVPFPTLLRPQIESITRTTTDFAATIGGGIGILTSDHWSLDIDARFIGIFGQRDARVGRYGGGVTYRF